MNSTPGGPKSDEDLVEDIIIEEDAIVELRPGDSPTGEPPAAAKPRSASVV